LKKYPKEGNRQFIETGYIWPISKSVTPDEMNTSFGPRINNNKWNFHEGCDLPAPLGTPVYAMHSGEIVSAGDGDNNFSSRHVVIQSVDPTNSKSIFLVYLHLSYIDDKNIKKGVKVEIGQYIGNVGSDGATYPHLHFEFREGTISHGSSIHPLIFYHITILPIFMVK